MKKWSSSSLTQVFIWKNNDKLFKLQHHFVWDWKWSHGVFCINYKYMPMSLCFKIANISTTGNTIYQLYLFNHLNDIICQIVPQEEMQGWKNKVWPKVLQDFEFLGLDILTLHFWVVTICVVTYSLSEIIRIRDKK